MAFLESWSVISSLCKDQGALKNLQCPFCENLLRNPVQPTCGHRLCQLCADKIIKSSTPPTCPQVDCEEEFTTEDGAHYFPDRFVRREIQALEVKCKFQDEGCSWEGTYGDLPSHLNTCKYAFLGMKLCPLQSLGCSNKSSMDDNELREHLRVSEYSHLTTIVNCIQQLSEKVSKLQGRNLQWNNLVEADGADNGYETMDVPGYERIPVSYYDQLERDGSTTSVKVKGTRGAPQSMPAKPLYRATVEVPNALSTSQLREIMNREMEDLKSKVLSSTMESLQSKDEEIASLRAQITKLEKQIRSKNAELEDRDFRLSLIENSNHDGSMIWKIPQFSQRKADAENGKYTSIFSLPFYSGRYGYKMCLRLYIMGDGIGKGTHLSLFFVVMRGEFDNILQWPFTHKVTFKLINQAGGRDIVDTFQPDPMSSSFRKPKSDMNIASGCPRFVSHTELDRGGFVVDDTIFIKCMIDTSTIRHP